MYVCMYMYVHTYIHVHVCMYMYDVCILVYMYVCGNPSKLGKARSNLAKKVTTLLFQ